MTGVYLRNGLAAGVDGETLSAIEQGGVGAFLKEIARRLRMGRYWPQPVKAAVHCEGGLRASPYTRRHRAAARSHNAGHRARLTPLAIPRGCGGEEGGRSFWAFAEADTLWFDGALLLALWSVVRGRWRIGLSTAGLAVAMAYVVTNHGTLFRLREMVFAPDGSDSGIRSERETGRARARSG